MRVAAFLLAFCGMTYELVLAQSLSVLLGNSFLQYGLTIGLFMAGLGVGSHQTPNTSQPRQRLIRLQTILSLTAPLGFLILWLSSLFLPVFFIWPIGGLLIFSIGFLTGQELPLLMRGAGEGRDFPVLAADYFGMLAAAVVFPYLLLPYLGMLGSLCAAAILNALSIQILVSRLRVRVLYSGLPLGLWILLIYEEKVWLWFSHQYTSGLM